MISGAWKRAYAAAQKQELTFSGIRDRINKNKVAIKVEEKIDKDNMGVEVKLVKVISDRIKQK